MAAGKALGVWMDGVHVAELTGPRWNDVRCRYTGEALARWPQNAPLVSCSLPLSGAPLPARSFCIGLLPEGRALQTMASDAGLATNDTHGLLARYGRDVAGALVIGEHEPDRRRWDVAPYDEASLVAAVDDLDRRPLGSDHDSELSLAGLQDKLLLVDLGDGRWGRPLHGAPSTHILKADDPKRPGLVAAEAACLTLARAAGLTTIEHVLTELGDAVCLIVSRFDRERAPDGSVRRVHQEDLCQATGVNPEQARGRAKYEAFGGPSFRQAAELLDLYALDPAAELDRLVAVIAFTVLIGNADAHGKNLAVLHPGPQHITLAPLYDTVPTVLWPKLRTQAAMFVAGRRELPAVTLDDIVREATSWPHPARRARQAARDTIDRVLAALDHGAVEPGSPLDVHVRAQAQRLTSSPL